MSANRFDEVRDRAAARREEKHDPIDIHPMRDDGSLDRSTTVHQICTECSDDDVVAAIEFGDTIDLSDGERWPCPASDVDWLVSEVELLRRQVDVMAKALQLDADDLKRALAKEFAGGAA